MNLFFQQEVTDGGKRLILNISEEMEIDQFALNMMNYNEIDYLVPMQLVQYNAANYLQFDVRKENTLSSKIITVLRKEEVIQLLSSVLCALEEAEAYMLSDGNLLLDMNYIFVDEKNNCSFLYLPLKEELSTDGISFLQRLVEKIQPDYAEKDPYIFNILNAFSRGAITKISDLKEILRKNNTSVLSVNAEPEKMEEKAEISKDEKAVQNGKFVQIGKAVQNGNEKEVTAKEKGMPGVIPVLNIPGRENIPSNIPSKMPTDIRGISAATSEDGKKGILKKKQEGKEEAKKEEKKRTELKILDRIKKKPTAKADNPAAKIELPIAGIQKSSESDTNNEMYENYEQTVLMEKPQVLAVDGEATVYLNAEIPVAELERKRNGECIKIDQNIATLGSGNNVECRIADNKAISRRHATISRENGTYYIVDNHSSNGTWVNGNRLIPEKAVEISNDALIKLADEEFIFKQK